MRRRRRWLFIIIPVLVLGLCAGAYLVVSQNLNGEADQGQRIQRQARAVRQNLDELVTASGAIAPEEQYSLSFDVQGTVVSVTVQPGDRVTAGQALAMVDTTDLRIALAQAEQAVAAQQQAITQLYEPPDPLDLSSAQASLDSAQARLADAVRGPDASTIAEADAAVRQAWNSYLQADAQRNAVLDNPATPNDERAPLDASAGMASVSYQIARYQAQQARQGPAAASIASARAQLVQAQAALEELNAPPSETDLETAQLQLASLQNRLERARFSLAAATLVAPHDGVIATVSLVAGQRAPASEAAIVLVDDSAYHMDLVVDEIDLLRLRVGQPATVTVDALPQQPFTGQVSRIAPVGTLSNNTMAYAIRVDMQDGQSLRPGLSASAQIVVARHADVLAVPTWAIHIDQQTRQAYVTVISGTVGAPGGPPPGGTVPPGATRRAGQGFPGGTPPPGVTFEPRQRGQAGTPGQATAQFQFAEVPVTVGFQSDAFSEITAGLREGQIVVQLQTVQMAGGVFQFLRFPGTGGVFRGGR